MALSTARATLLRKAAYGWRIFYGRKRQAGRFAVLKGPVVYAYAPPADDQRHPLIDGRLEGGRIVRLFD